MQDLLLLDFANTTVRVDCSDRDLAAAVRLNFSGLLVAEPAKPELVYALERFADRIQIRETGGIAITADHPADALFLLEKAITVAVQRLRPELLFLHAAALGYRGLAYVLAAESGHGKSTTTWGLLNNGFEYLSDELSPVLLDRREVLPYPYALGLKARPPEYPLPAGTVENPGQFHVPVTILPGAVAVGPRRIGGVIFVRFSPEHSRASIGRIGAAQAAAQLYPCVLNALSHPSRGLDAVLELVRDLPCFSLEAARLSETCALIRRTIDELPETGARRAPDRVTP